MGEMKREMDDVELVRQDSIKKSKVLNESLLTTSRTNFSISKDLKINEKEDREIWNERGHFFQNGGSEDQDLKADTHLFT